MRIDEIIVMPAIADKLATKHQVETYEVEEVFCGAARFRFVEKGEREGEDVYMAYGQTDAGRYL